MGLIASAVISLTLAADLWQVPTPSDVVLDGWATYYAPGLMARVAANRGLIEDPSSYDAWLEAQGLAGAVALNRAADLGRRVWIRGPAAIEGPFLAIDCAQAAHYVGRRRSMRVVEVDYATAERWGMRGPVSVRVYFQPPAYSIGKVRFQPH